MKDDFYHRIQALKPAPGFVVIGEKARAKAMKQAAELVKFEKIKFEVSTREIEPGKFKVFAL